MGRYSGIYYKSDSVKKCYSKFHLLLSTIRNPATAQGFSFYRFSKMMRHLTPEFIYLLIGAGCSFVMAYLRSVKRTFAAKICEALTCSMLSSALILIAEYYLHWPLELGVAIGTFVGFLGSDYISAKIKQIINVKVEGDSAHK